MGRRRALRRRPTCSAFPGYYTTGDGGYIDADGYLYVLGRTDDVINVAGHRLSTGVIEAVVAAHPAVAECAVIGVADDLKGQAPRAFVVLKAGVDDRPRRADPARSSPTVREHVGPVAALKEVVVVPGAAEDALRQDPAPHDARASPTAAPSRCPRRSRTPSVLDILTPLLRRHSGQAG